MPVSQRRDVWASAMLSTEVPQLLDFVPWPDPPAHRLNMWPLLPGVHLIELSGTPVRVRRRTGDLRTSDPERVAISLPVGFGARAETLAGQRRLSAGDLHLVDQTSPNDFSGLASGSSPALIMDYASAGVTIDAVRACALSLTANPLYLALRSQLRELTDLLHRSDDPVAHLAMAEGTLQLFRAMVQIGAHDPDEARAWASTALVARVKLFIRQHLSDHNLNPQSIADAHHVSLRTLYYAWGATEVPLAHWVMRQRLEAARIGLAGRTSISTLAIKYGFSSSSHFARRFRTVYGMTPSAWRSQRQPPGVD